jgi:anti-sigma regulatory factor (Ser/Thr protein kinase)
MVSELATNAVLHAKAQFDLVLERVDRNTVRVEVRDFGGGIPQIVAGLDETEFGRGLRIVDLLAQTWGIENRTGGRGKTTWFTVSAHGAAG